MRLHQIDLNLLVTFDAIYAAGSLTRAAKVLHLSQPAISHALARLRTLFDDPLFTRSAGGMTPTPFARSIAEPVRRALSSLEQEIAAGRTFHPGALRRRFNLGLRDVLEGVWLPRLAARLAREAPHVDLVVQRVKAKCIEGDLAEGTVDLVLDVTVPVSESVKTAALVESGYVVGVRAKHPLLQERKPLTLEAYLALGHVRVSSNPRSPGLEDLAIARVGRRRRIAVRCQSFAAGCRIAAASDLALTLPAVCAPLIEADGLVLLPLPFPMADVPVHLYWHASNDADPANTWMRGLVTETVRGTPTRSTPLPAIARRSRRP
jgi:DNA-binding transcriptional LysR family regulator